MRSQSILQLQGPQEDQSHPSLTGQQSNGEQEQQAREEEALGMQALLFPAIARLAEVGEVALI